MRKFFFLFFPPNHSVFSIFFFYTSCQQDGSDLGKQSSTNSERVTKQEKVTNPEETAMCEEVMAELKSMRGDLKNQISALSENLKDFQRNTNARLEKIESVISKLDEIDVLTTEQKDLEKDVKGVKASVDAMNATVSEMDSLRGGYTELQKKLEHLERYSRDYNIRVIGVDEESGEDCTVYGNCLKLRESTGSRRRYRGSGECTSYRKKTGRQTASYHCQTIQQAFQENAASDCQEC